MSRRSLVLGLTAGMVGWGLGVAEAADPADVAFFETKIRPALVEHCLECHGAEADPPDGNLRLDLRAGWEIGGDSGPALTPGDVDGSVLMEALRYETYEMPPEGKLPDHVVADFAKWIERGAVDPRGGTLEAPDAPAAANVEIDEWTYRTPTAEPIPAVRDEAWPRTPADRFILARLEDAGLTPAADAPAATAFRRLHFDLSGLPPDADALAEFQADPSEARWAAAVDRLLASPRFGQTWGRHWLDVARYADSNGSDFNATWPDAWRYRDYVIEAFNDDLPFDRFLTEQIAGDLLPADTDADRARQTIATGFLALGTKMLSERDKVKLTMDVADDQIDTVGRAAMGLTLGCARCHDHKFDPIPTRDYYALAGIFASTKTLDGEMQKYVSDFVRVPLPEDPAVTAARKAHKAAVAKAEAAVKDAKAAVDAAGLVPEGAIAVDDADAKAVGDWKASTYSKPFYGKGYLHDDKSGKGEKSLTFTATLPAAGRWEARLLYAGSGGRASNVPVKLRTPDGETEMILDQTKPGPLFGRAAVVGEYEAMSAGEVVSVIVRNDGTEGHVLADAVVFAPLADESVDPAAHAAAKALVAETEATLKALKDNAPPPAPNAFAVTDRPRDEIADTAIRIRGEARQEGETVPRGFLSVCGGGSEEIPEGSGRLELAEWVTRPDHPLTGRVFVNRVWGHLFGRGIVSTADNFGVLGAPPTHPKLLDRLAAEFVADGWRIKPLVRRLVTSRAYRLSSVHPDALENDPENELFARANRRRLTAEALRDTTLWLAGQLEEAPPGRSPVSGFGRLAVDTASGKPTGPVEVNALAVRSVYLPLIRNELPDALAVFDFADPESVIGVRPATNGPAQSLFLLNAPQVRARAEAAADRFRTRPGEVGERVSELYRATFSRDPSEAEIRRAVDYLDAAAARDGEAVAWADFAHVLFCSAEFRFLD
ncbi:DUF1553 domain-containing protein [Alienimonas chondri]|uniref:Xanthan lyase n=1 Tax=Alienimonas chondri TaxID=2681879 RepID=A0ABX1V9E6_9PLAN|nr:DUF1553 domain-containing protein [Alienimonas chondri]NNJ24081.1 hypothetical protein [Alienimonas chondri]